MTIAIDNRDIMIMLQERSDRSVMYPIATCIYCKRLLTRARTIREHNLVCRIMKFRGMIA